MRGDSLFIGYARRDNVFPFGFPIAPLELEIRGDGSIVMSDNDLVDDAFTSKINGQPKGSLLAFGAIPLVRLPCSKASIECIVRSVIIVAGLSIR